MGGGKSDLGRVPQSQRPGDWEKAARKIFGKVSDSVVLGKMRGGATEDSRREKGSDERKGNEWFSSDGKALTSGPSGLPDTSNGGRDQEGKKRCSRTMGWGKRAERKRGSALARGRHRVQGREGRDAREEKINGKPSGRDFSCRE